MQFDDLLSWTFIARPRCEIWLNSEYIKETADFLSGYGRGRGGDGKYPTKFYIFNLSTAEVFKKKIISRKFIENWPYLDQKWP